MSDPTTRLNAALEGRYQIVREIGKGGMATVYLADDLRHGRSVALKVLKPELAAVVGAERFLAEIRTTAKLQHPHILTLHDSGEADGYLYYVMPYVDGESLRERLDREKLLPVDEAIAIAAKVAAALQHAHEHGVVHRDVKPANILLSGGEPLVSDFGIALALSEAGGGRITETGLSMGTPHYMSPEQASGERMLDRRSDVYALGCVAYEMLTGQPPYSGPTAQAVLGRILTGEPTPPSEHRKAIPVNIEHTLLKALEKLPADRFASAADFARALRDPAYRVDKQARAEFVAAGARNHVWKAVAFAALGMVVVLSGLLLWGRYLGPGGAEVERQRIVLGSDITTLEQVVAGGVALAPDGSGVLFADSLGFDYVYWWKASGDADAVRIANMDNARAPVFSPDGQWLAYVVDGELRKQPLRGGTPVRLADGVNGAGVQALTWLESGVLIVENGGPILERIGEDGVQRDTISDFMTTGYPIHASGLPGGGAALVSSCTNANCIEYRLFLVDLERDTVAALADQVLRAWPGPDGYVVFVLTDGSVFAARLHRGALRLDPPIPLFGGVATAGSLPTIAQMEVGADGTLLYVRGQGGGGVQFRVVWVDRDGAAEPVDPNWGFDLISDPALSPDGERLALTIEGQIWVKELPAGPLSQITAEEGVAERPAWTRDGESIVYHAGDGSSNHLRTVRSDGSSPAPDTLLILDEAIYQGLAPDSLGRLVFRAGGTGARDIGYVDLSGDTTPVWLLNSEFEESTPALSPDGRWLAYTSDRSGRPEIYVRPFPEADRRIPMSSNGGMEPQWAHSGTEIFYRDEEGWLTSATVTTRPDFLVTSRERLFDASGYRLNSIVQTFDVAPDDQRFVMLQSAGTEQAGHADLILVENWFREVREAVRR